MNKRGINHIEVILTFILFVSAIGFALWFFNPIGGSRFVDSSLDYGFREVLQNTTIKLESFSVKINNASIPPGESKVAVVVPLDISPNMKTRVRTHDGAVFNSFRDGSNNVQIESNLADGWQSVKLITVDFSDDFKDESFSDVSLDPSYYEFFSSESKEVISEKRFIELKKDYDYNYESLREDFNLNVGFGFSLVFENGSIVAEKQIPSELEVFSDKKRVEVLRNETEELEFADLVVKVW